MRNIANHRVQDNTVNENPMWMILHRPVGDPQRRRWCPDIARLAADLVEKYGWVTWREGQDAHFKHRSMLVH